MTQSLIGETRASGPTSKVGEQQPRLVAAHRKPITYCEPPCPEHLCREFSRQHWCRYSQADGGGEHG